MGVKEVQARYPGVYMLNLPVYDKFQSLVTDMNKQLEAITVAIQNDSNLVDGFNFYGESQGALLARAYVTSVNNPPVYNLVSLCGPQDGVGECPEVEIPVVKQLCGDFVTDIDTYRWPECSFCGYWRGKNKHTYLENSAFLANVNNDRSTNETRRQNMISLNKYMATMSLRDNIVQPRESAWHTHWYWDDETRSRVMPLNETSGYKNDALGLRTLNERGDLILNSFDGPHAAPSEDWWKENILPMLVNEIDDHNRIVV